MIESACSKEVACEIEPLLSEGKYAEARLLLSHSIEQDPSDRESRLYLLLVNVTLDGPVAYEDEIDHLRELVHLSNSEKEIVRRLFVLGFEAAEKDGREEQAWIYQRLLRRLLLAQALDQPLSREPAGIAPASEASASEIAHDTRGSWRECGTLQLKERFIAWGWLIAVGFERIWFSVRSRIFHTGGSTGKPKLSPRGALAFAAVALLLIPIAYLGSPRSNAAKETPSYTAPELSLRLPRPRLTSSVFSQEPMPLPQHHDGAKSFNKKQVHSMLAGQLSDLRSAYTDWNQKDRNLMGSVLIKLQINASGDVIEAQEQTSRLTDLAFGNVVLSEARKWKFPKFNDEFSEVVVPLVFVPQGMDPQTIVRWEKALTSSDLDPNAVSPLHITGSPSGDGEREPSVASDRPPADLKNPKMAVASVSKIQATEEPAKNLLEYKTRRAAPLREEPHFAAASAEDISPGTRVSVLEAKGDWFKVKSRLSGKIGYVRKEYIAPVSAVQ